MKFPVLAAVLPVARTPTAGTQVRAERREHRTEVFHGVGIVVK